MAQDTRTTPEPVSNAPAKADEKKGKFTADLLKEDEKKLFTHFNKRIIELQKGRKNHYGRDIDTIWSEADRDYIPHRLSGSSTGQRTALVEVDETKGWRSGKIQLGQDNWQSDISQMNVFIKIQTALSILVDQNPTGVFTPALKKFQATNELIKQLYERSWEFARSKEQLKLFIFNLSKYGWAVGRTYPLRIDRKVKVLKEYNAEDPEKSVYEEKEVTEYDDIMRENLDPRNTWIDNMAKPNNSLSLNDWAWRKVYDMDDFNDKYGNYKYSEYVQAGGTVTETIGNASSTSSVTPTEQTKQIDTANLVEVYFYENKLKDVFMIIANGVPICIDPLPVANTNGLKKLSLWQTYWNIRHGESPYGVGIYEAIRYDQAMLDRVRNMTVDQLVLSIYKMFFYQGTASLTDTGDIKIRPGYGKQVLDPKNITWLEIPGPGKDAYAGLEMFKKDVDDASGITDPLLGQVTGKTAFEIAQSKEAALKRMKNPLDNILEALNEEGYITVCLMQLLYTVPEVYEITDARLIDDYLKEINGDTDLFEREPLIDPETGDQQTDEAGNPMNKFNALVYREFPLNLEKDNKGNLTTTKETQFFRTKPDALEWEGIIAIKSSSLLSPSKQVDKALDLEMYNMLIPILQGIAQERMMYMQAGQPVDIDDLTNGKTAKAIIKLYDKDPRDILPDPWLEDTSQSAGGAPNGMGQMTGGAPAGQGNTPPAGPGGAPTGNPPLFVNNGGGQPAPAQAGPAGGAPTVVPSTQSPQNPQSFIGKIASAVTKPFRS